MKTYLRVVNPIVAVLVLALCLLAAAFDEGVFKPAGLLRGGIPTYFLAKGIFCSSALFILGQLLLHLVGGQKGPQGGGTGR
jgi:hypothetical protein